MGNNQGKFDFGDLFTLRNLIIQGGGNGEGLSTKHGITSISDTLCRTLTGESWWTLTIWTPYPATDVYTRLVRGLSSFVLLLCFTS